MKRVKKLNKKIINGIRKLSSYQIILFYVVLFILGRFIDIFLHFQFSLIHQINLSVISYVLLHILNIFYNFSINYEKKFYNKNVTLHREFKRLNRRLFSIWNIVIPFLACCVFAFTIFFLHYLPMNFMGIYGAVIATTSFFLALMAYYAFANSIICIYRLKEKSAESLPFEYPNDVQIAPNWIKDLQKIFKKAQTSIFAVGTLFTLEYILLVPANSIQIQPEFKINSEYPIVFMYNWIIIAVFIIVACPIMLFLTRKYLNQLFDNMYFRAKKTIDNVLGIDASNLSIDNLLTYQQLMKNLKSTDMYKLKNDLLYPIVATSLSLFLNLLKLFESYLFPFLRDSV